MDNSTHSVCLPADSTTLPIKTCTTQQALFIDNSTGASECFPCPSGCVQCYYDYIFGKVQCTACNTSLPVILKSGVCQIVTSSSTVTDPASLCASVEYYNYFTQQCATCLEGCATCKQVIGINSMNIQCFKCFDGYYQAYFMCVKYCLDGQMAIYSTIESTASTTKWLCRSCSRYQCAYCEMSYLGSSPKEQCYKCQKGYMLAMGICEPEPICEEGTYLEYISGMPVCSNKTIEGTVGREAVH